MDVRIRSIDDCYDELPVLHNNNSWFMLPFSHILSKYATKRSCSLPAPYRIGSQWINLSPEVTSIKSPADIFSFNQITDYSLKKEIIASLEQNTISNKKNALKKEQNEMLRNLVKRILNGKVNVGDFKLNNWSK